MTFMKINKEMVMRTTLKVLRRTCDRGITGGLAIVKAGDDYLYYLVKLIFDPFATESETKDYYNHTYPPEHKIVIGNYLDTQRH